MHCLDNLHARTQYGVGFSESLSFHWTSFPAIFNGSNMAFSASTIALCFVYSGSSLSTSSALHKSKSFPDTEYTRLLYSLRFRWAPSCFLSSKAIFPMFIYSSADFWSTSYLFFFAKNWDSHRTSASFRQGKYTLVKVCKARRLKVRENYTSIIS